MNDPNQQPISSPEPQVAAEAAPKGRQRAADRLNIPSTAVRGAGFAPGDKAFVVDEDPAGAVSKPCLVVIKVQPPQFVAEYTVAKGCRIRVTPVILKKCGLEGDTFKIDSSDGKIAVT